MPRPHRTAWMMVAALSLGLAGLLAALWLRYDCCTVQDSGRVRSEAAVEAALQNAGAQDLFRLPTGLFVQSLSFVAAHDVQVVGRLWQRLPPGATLPKGATLGVLFPDAISPHDANLSPVYQNVALPDGARLYLWDFQVVLRQRFNYDAYPLDGKLVWIRLWTRDLADQVQLVPDLGAYAATGAGAGLGISDSLVTGEWAVRDTFFGLRRMTYGTDFGRNSGTPANAAPRPELRFNVVLQRNFTDAFLVNLVPLALTLGLLFGLVVSIGRDPGVAGRLGFSTLAVFGSCAGLFFTTLLGHIQIRQEFAGSQIVYLEYFYIVTYGVLLSVSVLSFAIAHPDTGSKGWLLRGDGRNAKLIYWPAILAALVLVTLWKLPGG